MPVRDASAAVTAQAFNPDSALVTIANSTVNSTSPVVAPVDGLQQFVAYCGDSVSVRCS